MTMYGECRSLSDAPFDGLHDRECRDLDSHESRVREGKLTSFTDHRLGIQSGMTKCRSLVDARAVCDRPWVRKG